jgi:hypothetical protein
MEGHEQAREKHCLRYWAYPIRSFDLDFRFAINLIL